MGGVRGWWRGLTPSQRVLGGGGTAAALLVVAGALVWLAIPRAPVPRARQYLAFTACLLTDSRGLAGAQAAQVWSGMERASLVTRAKVEYLPVMSGATVDAAAPYVASLAQRHCRVVVADGAAEAAAVRAVATRYPSVRFVVVGPSAPGERVTVLTPGSGLPGQADRLITDAVRKGGGGANG